MLSMLMRLKKFYKFLSPRWQKLYMEYPVQFSPRYGHGKPPHGQLYTIIQANRQTYSDLLQEALNYTSVFHGIKKQVAETDTLQPAYNNDFLPGLDIVGIYTILAKYNPERYVEVGSGNSTKVAHKAIKEQGLQTKIISIDPHPRAEIDTISDEVIRKPFENVDVDFLLSLKENDILFIDNSHRVLPNSDAMVFFMEILPRLQPGVIVHIHDIYLPYDYPPFMCDRFYSEQYTLAAFILANPTRYATLLPNYFISEDKELRKILAPIWNHPNLKDVEQHGGSYWITLN
jgi:hypothetical protein